jgi:hypothetical protein
MPGECGTGWLVRYDGQAWNKFPTDCRSLLREGLGKGDRCSCQLVDGLAERHSVGELETSTYFASSSAKPYSSIGNASTNHNPAVVTSVGFRSILFDFQLAQNLGDPLLVLDLSNNN